MRLFIFVTFIAWAYAADGGFTAFCKEDLVGNVENSKDPKTPDDKTCTKTFDLEGVADGASVCRHRSRFAVKEAKAEGNTLTCTWETTGNCEDGHYIYGHCYKMFSTCTGDWKLVAINDQKAFRWIAYTFGNERVAKFRTSASVKTPTKVYSPGQLAPLGNGKATEIGILLSSMPVFGGHPGEAVYLGEGVAVVSVCRKLAIGGRQTTTIAVPEGDPKNPTNPTNHGSGGTSLAINAGNFTLIPTRSVYQPKLTDKGDVDLHYFHKVCEKICDGCYAATMSYLAKLPEDHKKLRYWLSGARKFVESSNNCVKTRDSALDLWKLRYHTRHPEAAILHRDEWADGHPNQECSDQGRYAMAYENGKVISVPIFDRLPLVCVLGSQPPIPKSVSNCLKNSENDGNGRCKCKKGYKDVKEASSLEGQTQSIKDYVANNLKDEQKGYVCVLDTCNQEVREVEPPFESILFVIDGSGSIINCLMCAGNFDLIRDFMHNTKNWLTKKASMFFMQYSTDYETQQYEPKFAKVAAGWTEAEFSTAVSDVLAKHLKGQTPTYKAIDDMITYWLNSGPSKRKAIMIIITDGEPYNDPGLPKRAAIIQRARDNGIDIKYVGVGTFKDNFMIQDVLDPKKDIIKMDSYAQMADELKAKMEQFLKCTPITESEIDDARRAPYQ